jgi:DNA recombination protein RmuC
MSDVVLIAIVCVIAGLAAGALIVFVLRTRTAAVDPIAEAQKLAEAQRNAEALSNLNTRLDDMAKWLHGSHGQLKQTMDTRLDAVTARLGESLSASANTTAEHLQNLHARLAVIDSAQKNISELATSVSSLQTVLASKQQRGAFGQSRMEIIIQDGLPKDCYAFQDTLSNRNRPDCCVFLPDSPKLVIDAKFPLEAVTLLREAKTDDEKKLAGARVRSDVGKHIADIAGKYLIPGETQELALMFVPSESIYADLYDGFDDVFQKAYRAKVIIVSPSLLMLAIQVIQQIRKDARMREAASQIVEEVALMMADVTRLRERVEALDKHFGQASKDIQQVVTSANKIMDRGEKIQAVDFGEAASPPAQLLPQPERRIEAAE